MFIVHLICSFTTGGSETMLVDIINEQRKAGHSVALIIINNLIDDSLLSFVDNSVRIIRIDRIPGSRTPWCLIRLNYLLYKLNGDILHSHDSVIAGMLFPFFRKRLCLTVHMENAQKKYLSCYKTLIAISDTVKSDLERRTSFHIDLICNGINTNEILKKRDWQLNNPIRIVMVSRLEHLIKGQDILLKALHQLIHQDNRDIILDFIGEGGSKNYLESLVDSYQLSSNVNFLGVRSRSYIYSHLFQYDLLIQPSINEGFGLTVVEAMIARVPVLVSGNGPMEIIGQGKYGYSFNSGDVAECKEKMSLMFDHYSELENLVNIAAQHANDKYSIQKTVSSYVHLYRSMIGCTEKM